MLSTYVVGEQTDLTHPHLLLSHLCVLQTTWISAAGNHEIESQLEYDPTVPGTEGNAGPVDVRPPRHCLKTSPPSPPCPHLPDNLLNEHPEEKHIASFLQHPLCSTSHDRLSNARAFKALHVARPACNFLSFIL